MRVDEPAASGAATCTSVNSTLRIAASRAPHCTATVEDFDPSTPTTIPKRVGWSGILLCFRSPTHIRARRICRYEHVAVPCGAAIYHYYSDFADLSRPLMRS